MNGGLAIAVPLELKGLWLAHQRHGNMSWGDLVTPVIPLARDGFPLHPYLAAQIGDGEWWALHPPLPDRLMAPSFPKRPLPGLPLPYPPLPSAGSIL